MPITLEMGLGKVEIDAADVVRLTLQFLREHGLTSSAAELQRESGIGLNAIERRDVVISDVRSGKWDQVLPAVAALELPRATSLELYEHIALELLESREADAARELMRTSPALRELRGDAPERFQRLERLLSRCATGSASASYAGALEDVFRRDEPRDVRRNSIADDIMASVGEVQPSRLTALLGQALRWRAHVGELDALSGGSRVDVWRGAGGLGDARGCEPEKPVKRAAGSIRFGADSRALACAFLPDGSALCTGSSDGFVEVWDTVTCRLRTDLAYQAQDELMMHDDPVLALAPSADGDALASGDRGGCLKVWRLATGTCARKFAKAHTSAVSAIAWSRDGSTLLSAGADGAVRTHGLKSGRQLQHFRGHSSFVNAVAFLALDVAVSVSADGTARVWDARSAECQQVMRPAAALAAAERRAVVAVDAEKELVGLCLVPGMPDRFIVVDRSCTAALLTTKGELLASFSSKADPAKLMQPGVTRAPGCDFLAAALSQPTGEWLYLLAADGNVYCFQTKTGHLERILHVQLKPGDVNGIATHPFRNLVATFGDSDQLKLWKP